MKNAIILAAGKSNRLAPFMHETPKGLFCVKGEIFTEDQIEQLKIAGVNEIYEGEFLLLRTEIWCKIYCKQ